MMLIEKTSIAAFLYDKRTMIGHVIYLVLSSHLADPTLTIDNLIEVMKEEKHRWKDLARKLGLSAFDISFVMHGMEDVADEYVRRYPTPSWKQVALALQEMELHKLADEVTTKYVRGINMTVTVYYGT